MARLYYSIINKKKGGTCRHRNLFLLIFSYVTKESDDKSTIQSIGLVNCYIVLRY